MRRYSIVTLMLMVFFLFSCDGLMPADNVSADPTLAPYVCSQNIATRPGDLCLLPIGTAGSPQVRAYVEYVPPNYASQSKWPLIIYLHGDDGLGNGSSTGVMLPLSYSGLPGRIGAGNWDNQQRFVVLAPQFASYADRSALNVHQFIQYAKANYHVDTGRIYLTAVSGGGVALGAYLAAYNGGEAAAALPVACYLPPVGQVLKWKRVPLWMICGAADTTVGPSNLATMYNNLVNAIPTVQVRPRLTLYTALGHEAAAVDKTYAPALNDNALETWFQGIDLDPYSNIYDWFLQYR